MNGPMRRIKKNPEDIAKFAENWRLVFGIEQKLSALNIQYVRDVCPSKGTKIKLISRDN